MASYRNFMAKSKSLRDESEWKRGKITSSTFPFAKTMKLSKAWQWKVYYLEENNQSCRVLVTFNEHKSNVSAYFAYMTSAGGVIATRYEDHATHPGIHIHTLCDEIPSHTCGIKSFPNQIRIPNADAFHRKTFTKDDNGLLRRHEIESQTEKFFKIKRPNNDDRQGELI